MPRSASNWSHIFPGIRREGQSFNRAFTYFDDFDAAGYARDLALSAESDPAGGKFSEVIDASEWHVTNIDGGGDNGETILIADARNGVLAITTNDANDDAVTVQKNGESIGIAAGKDFVFEAKIKLSDVDKADLMIGLCITDTTLLPGITDGLYFRIADGTASRELIAVAEKDSVETTLSTGVSLVDDTFVTVRFEVFGSDRAVVYVNGVNKGELTTNLPDDELLAVAAEVRNAGAQVNTLSVDYYLAVQDR